MSLRRHHETAAQPSPHTHLSDARVALWGWSVFYGSAAGEHTGRRRIDGTFGLETIVRNDTEGNREGQPTDGTVSDTK